MNFISPHRLQHIQGAGSTAVLVRSRGYCYCTYASFWVRRGFGQDQRRRMMRLPHDKAELVKGVLRAQGVGRGSAGLEEQLVLWRQTAPMELDRPTRSGQEGKSPLAMQLPGPAVVDVAVHDVLIEEADFPDGPAIRATCAADSGNP